MKPTKICFPLIHILNLNVYKYWKFKCVIYKDKWAKYALRWAATCGTTKTLTQESGLLVPQPPLFVHCMNTAHICDNRLPLEQ